jgi:regulator of protease activity HflC (stomatin/prohibitin superfamily)
VTVTTTVGLAIILPVACWLATSLRRVPGGQRVVVVRRGRVRRVHDAGLAVRVPVLDRFEHDPVGAHELPLMVRAATADGLRVLVLAEVTVSLPAPRPGTAYADPWLPAEVAAQETIARVVATWTAAELTRSALEAQRPLRHAVSAAVDDHGVTLLDLELAEVDVQLDEDVFDRGRP